MSFGSDAIIAQLKQDGGPITRERYILFRYMGTPPEELSAEEESEIPDYPWDDDDGVTDGGAGVSDRDARPTGEDGEARGAG